MPQAYPHGLMHIGSAARRRATLARQKSEGIRRRPRIYCHARFWTEETLTEHAQAFTRNLAVDRESLESLYKYVVAHPPTVQSLEVLEG